MIDQPGLNMVNILLSTVIITLFCLGWRTVISPGQLLHFLREPFEYEGDSKVINFLKRRLQRRALAGVEGITQLRKDYVKLSNRITWIMKPLVICVICFSSAWGSTIFVTINGWQIREMIIACVSAAFLIKIIHAKVDW